MADDNQVCEEQPSQHPHGGLGAIPGIVLNVLFTMPVKSFFAMFHAATRDGTLAAGFRQGAGEIGEALKAFPDSIQVHEPGTVLNPTQGEIAAARDPHTPSHSMVANDNVATVHGEQQGYGQAATVHGQEQSNGQEPAQEKEDKQGFVDKERERQGKASQDGHGDKDPNKEKSFVEDLLEERAKANQGGSTGDEQNEKKSFVEDLLEERAKGKQDGNAGNEPIEKKSFVEELLEERAKANQDGNAGNDQSGEARGRSLPEEQREQELDPERGRGRSR